MGKYAKKANIFFRKAAPQISNPTEQADFVLCEEDKSQAGKAFKKAKIKKVKNI